MHHVRLIDNLATFTRDPVRRFCRGCGAHPSRFSVSFFGGIFLVLTIFPTSHSPIFISFGYHCLTTHKVHQIVSDTVLATEEMMLCQNGRDGAEESAIMLPYSTTHLVVHLCSPHVFKKGFGFTQ